MVSEVERDMRYFALRKKHVRQYDSEFLAFTNADTGMFVLEIGCGTGIFSRYLQQKGFTNVVCLDLDERLASVLSDLDPFQVVFEDAEAYLDSISGKQTFDLIVMQDVLEHLPLEKTLSMFRAFYSALAPSGRVLIRTPNLSSPWGARLFYGGFDHVTPYSPDRVREIAALTNFQVVRMAGQKTGKRRKQIAANILHGILSRILPEHPEIWEANLVALLEKQKS
ncbi:MAG: class I SAM-dependent methyltransferase [Rhodospirillales bacterium]|jgi:2-polyprenyl-3-methyl-5-hydroxy-6-metoxy-1,4-benzoquinol methylase|nr:class I SAM-dependent methyltransferase [Rhodospirillales bacterium]